MWRISKRHPRIRTYECVVQNLRNVILWCLPRFARARARRARSRSSPRKAPSKRVERVVPLGRIAPLGIRKIRNARFFPIRGALLRPVARARARARGFAVCARRNAAETRLRDATPRFATRPERLRHARETHHIKCVRFDLRTSKRTRPNQIKCVRFDLRTSKRTRNTRHKMRSF